MQSTCPGCGVTGERRPSAAGLLTCEACRARYLSPDSSHVVLTTQSETDPGEHIELPPEVTNHWRLEILLGAGAMGVVYSARDRITNQNVAIKFLSRVDNPELRTRFAREAKLMGKIQHPNVVQVFEAGETKGYPFLVMELVDGMSLRERVEQEGAFDPAEAVDVTLQLLSGLEYCHAKGVIHRDIKPENAMITKAGEVKLADLGIALDTAATGTKMTRSGILVVTPSYMAPEVLQGEKATVVSDLYSVGVTLYEMLTGKQPYAAKSFYDLVSLHYSTRPRPPHETLEGVPLSLSELVMEALSLHPGERPGAADEFADRLRAVKDELARGVPSRVPGGASLAGGAADGAAGAGTMAGAGASRPGTGEGDGPGQTGTAAGIAGARDSGSAPGGESSLLASRAGEPQPSRAARTVAVGLAVALVALGAGAMAWRARQPERVGSSPASASARSPSPGEVTRRHPAYVEGKRHYDAGQYDKSFPLFVQAAEAGDRDAMFRLGASYTKARGTKSDPELGAKWYLKAAELGHVDAQVSIGAAYSRGAGVAQDAKEAFRWLTKAAEASDVPAMTLVGQAYIRGEGVTRDAVKGNEWLRRAANHDYPEACGLLGVNYLNGSGVEKDEEEAFRWLERAAAGQLPEGYFNLAVCYVKGRGTPVRPDEALRCLEKAAELAYAPAPTMLGDLARQGVGQKRDDAKAAGWYARAAELGDPPGMREMARCLNEGRGVVKDVKRAAELLERAVLRGDTGAEGMLALMLADGVAVPRDLPRARRLLENAAGDGSSAAQTMLALEVERGGMGYTPDKEKALKMFRRAAEAGSVEACDLMADRCAAAGQKEEAQRWLKRAAELRK